MSDEPERPDDILLRNFERRLQERGGTAASAYFPNDADRPTRFDIMLDVIEFPPSTPIVLCDLGCGTGELLTHIRERRLENVTYIGADWSQAALSSARAKFPDERFVDIDVNAPDASLDQLACDYLVANGIFTAKSELTYEQMWSLLTSIVGRVWPKVRRGLAFNVMSKIVDQERACLFHVPMDDVARLLHGLAGRRVRLCADYGLCERTAYAFKPEEPAQATPVAGIPPIELSEDLPVLRPQLPPAGCLLPYLQRIDAARTYTNHGPLSAELEGRLAMHLKLPVKSVTCASSGTAALIGAILAAAGRAQDEKPFALIPAFTFAATAVAAEQCGYRPYIVDVDPTTWMLEPEALAGHSILSQAGLIIPVAPFGRPVPQRPWLSFQEQTGVPVVIDGAASFDRVADAPAQFLGAIPVVLSFHATKAFGTGEGGAVASNDADLIMRVAQALNFGFHIARDSQVPSTNGKMSEYHAAVGLAELDGWVNKQLALQNVVNCYRKWLGERDFAGAPSIGLSYALFECSDAAEAEAIQRELQRRCIDTRLWYGKGLHHQTYFSTAPRDPLDVTGNIAPRLVGLPIAPDLTEAGITRVVSALTAARSFGNNCSSMPSGRAACRRAGKGPPD